MKTIIEMAREALLHRPCWEVWQDPKKDAPMWWEATSASSDGLERFATLVKAAHVAELLDGVEMQKASGVVDALGRLWSYEGQTYKDGDVFHSAYQLRSTVAAAVLRKDAEISTMTAIRDEYQRVADSMAMSHKLERDTLKAENERLRGALNTICSKLPHPDEFAYPNYFAKVELENARAAMKGQP